MENKYEDIIAGIDDLRTRFMSILLDNPKSFREIAPCIGVSQLTLARFAKTSKPIKFVTLCKIKKYVEAVESR